MNSDFNPIRFRNLRLLSLQQRWSRMGVVRWLLLFLLVAVLMAALVMYIREIRYTGYNGSLDIEDDASMDWREEDDVSQRGNRTRNGEELEFAEQEPRERKYVNFPWRRFLRYRLDLGTLSPEKTHRWIGKLSEQLGQNPALGQSPAPSRYIRNVQLDLALLLIQAGRSQEARQLIFDAKGSALNDVAGQYALGLLIQKTKSTAQAITIWEDALTILAQTRNGSSREQKKWDERLIRLALGRAYHAQARYQHAILEFKKIRKIDKILRLENTHFSTGLFLLSAKTFKAMGDEDSAKTLYQIVLQSASATTLSQRKTAAKNFLGFLIAEEKWADARTLMSRVRSWDPNDSEIILLENRIRLFASPETAGSYAQWTGAVDRTRTFDLYKNGNGNARVAAEDALYWREQAIQDLTSLVTSVSRRSILSQAYHLLGVAHQQNGDFQLALEAYEYALEFDPGNEEAYQNRRTLHHR